MMSSLSDVSRPWFDAATGAWQFDEYVMERASFKMITQDHVITDEELLNQSKRVTMLLQHLEGMLSPEARDTAMIALCELSVLNVLIGMRYRQADDAPQKQHLTRGSEESIL
jgi:hypothetical protein